MGIVRKAQEAFEKKDVAAAKEAHKHHEPHGDDAGEYVGDFVYGAIDGTITTFAVVSGATGAALGSGIVIILGFANMLADGFSMACGNFLSEKADKDYIAKERKREEWEIEHVPEGEVEEIREIYAKKGFAGKDLDRAVEIITSDKKVWVDTMMVDELGLLESKKNPYRSAWMTFFGFQIIGVIPLLAYVLALFIPFFAENTFPLAIVFTAVALAVIGIVKQRVTKKNLWSSIAETLFIGGAAAIISYYIGYLLRLLVGV